MQSRESILLESDQKNIDQFWRDVALLAVLRWRGSVIPDLQLQCVGGFGSVRG